MGQLEGYTGMLREWDTEAKISEVEKSQWHKNLGGGLVVNSYGLVGGELIEKVPWILRPDLWSDDPGRLLLLRGRTRDGEEEAGQEMGRRRKGRPRAGSSATREMNEVLGAGRRVVLRGWKVVYRVWS